MSIEQYFDDISTGIETSKTGIFSVTIITYIVAPQYHKAILY